MAASGARAAAEMRAADCAVHEFARGRWLLLRQSALGKTMASDDKRIKTSPASRTVTAVKEVAGKKKDDGQPKDKSTSDASKAESGEKGADSPAGYSRGEGQKPVSKAYKANWNAIYAKKKKNR
jgi:hypothetical protein